MVKNKADHLGIFSDLPGCSINRATIPQDILTVSGEGSKPDIVLLNRTKMKITVMELTSPLKRNIDAAYTRKMIKYTALKIDLEEKGFTVSLVPTNQSSYGTYLHKFR